MIKVADEVLERVLGKAGQPNMWVFGIGGMLGAKLAQRWQTTERYELTVGIPNNTDEVRKVTSKILQSMGKLVSPDLAPDSVSAIVSSHFIDTCPAIVHVEFNKTSNSSSELVIRGLAKEPLIGKPRSAQKAVEKLKARLLGAGA